MLPPLLFFKLPKQVTSPTYPRQWSTVLIVTTRVRERLKLPTDRRQTIAIKTFGSTEETTQGVDAVHLSVTTKHGEDVQLSAFVVPIICDPLPSQSIAQASLTYAHLKENQLGDYSTTLLVKIDILVGSDQYWNIVSGRVVRQEDGPTAILNSFLEGMWQTEDSSTLLATAESIGIAHII